jgi:hypothetical protein
MTTKSTHNWSRRRARLMREIHEFTARLRALRAAGLHTVQQKRAYTLARNALARRAQKIDAINASGRYSAPLFIGNPARDALNSYPPRVVELS